VAQAAQQPLASMAHLAYTTNHYNNLALLLGYCSLAKHYVEEIEWEIN